MYDLVILIGWGVTTAIVATLWARRHPGRSVAPGVVLGLVTGILWPITLWVAIGLWWYWRGRPEPVRDVPQVPAAQLLAKIHEAQAFARQSELENMPSSAAYWHAEVQRLSAQYRQYPQSQGVTAR